MAIQDITNAVNLKNADLDKLISSSVVLEFSNIRLKSGNEVI